MKLIKLILLVAIIPFLLTNCKKDKDDVPVEFELRVLNEQGQKTTTFKEGENVIFSFLITNKTNENLTFYHAEMNLENFFEVYKLNTPQGDISLGKPFKFLFCDKLGTLRIPKNDKLEITVPWIECNNCYHSYNGCKGLDYHNETYPFDKGDYMSVISSLFKIGGPLDATQHNFEGEIYINDILHFEIKFTIN